MGYLPEAMRNYLATPGLGPWRRGDLHDDAARRAGSTSGVGGAPARLDWDKLNHLNNHYIRQADPAGSPALRRRACRRWATPRRDLMRRCGADPAHDPGRSQTRAKTLVELAGTLSAVRRSAVRPLELPEKTRAKLLNEETRTVNSPAGARRSATDRPGACETLEARDTLRGDARGRGLGKIGPQPACASLAGGAPAPDLGWTAPGALDETGQSRAPGRRAFRTAHNAVQATPGRAG